MNKQETRPFFGARNLVDTCLGDTQPWDFKPGKGPLAQARGIPKKERAKWITNPATAWQVYSAVGGAVPDKRVGKGNQAAVVRGLVVDYDLELGPAEVEKLLKQMKPELQPQFIETSLSQKIRLVWVLERPMPVRDSLHAGVLLATLIEKMKLHTLLPGYDAASAKPEQVWTNGGAWRRWRRAPLAWKLAFGYATDAFAKLPASAQEIPIATIADEVMSRWPGRWQNCEFKLNALGVRFWDPVADCPTGCQVKPDGMLCFTGPAGFKSWRDLLGAEWVDQRRAINLAESASETYFDGSRYFQPKGGVWFDKTRDDLLLDIRSKGVSGAKKDGQTISDAERVLHHVQNANRVHGAAPLIYSPEGVVDVGGMRILNTSALRPTEPAGRVCTPADFSFLSQFLEGLFLRSELRPRDHFLAWLQRAYRALRDRTPKMGQAVFICGPPQNGKTLVSRRIVHPLLGNSWANPYKYFVGDTDFTDNLFGAALWAINDEESPAGAREKGVFQAKIKSSVVNPEQTYHPKFCKKMSLPWQGRILVTSNDDPQSAGMLPEVNESTRDKLMFFATQSYAGTWPENNELEKIIAAELPYFARWLLDWEPPSDLMEAGRMGVKSYFDPHLLDLSNQQSQFYGFKELLCLWAKKSLVGQGDPRDQVVWTGNPTELRHQLCIFHDMPDMTREWPVHKIINALTGLARVGTLGVTFVEGTQQRTFRVDKAMLLKTR